MTTTFETIRNQQATVIEALTPAAQSGVRFIRHREGTFMDWVEANPKACMRRFQISSNFDMEQGPTADGSVEGCRHTMELRVAYPLMMGRYGPENDRDMDDMMMADLHAIDAAIGLNGASNYVASQHICRKTTQDKDDVEGARVFSVTYEVLYDRSV